ncbi:branched-chain amino acid ABC transporter permease [Streptomyces europaeiscabiei]|uniref:branched-chain amino acid ABC transporter permease n=1 Tax=Streptomyces europaeiscabiei TaxID=146819 RepID=UPI0029A8CE27|nr:branched-chain amino acid ABC transporter permease [Streptomyces europaeiscabiei]MDX3587661.1 branched-chain amino acid ABC transporter permease [Streptomyces europaeiscabiei]
MNVKAVKAVEGGASPQHDTTPVREPLGGGGSGIGGRARGPERRRAVVAVVVVALLAAAPAVLAPYPVSAMTRMLAFAVLVLGVDLLTGVTGLPTLGQAAYFGVGAYTAVLVGVHGTSDAMVQVLAALVMGLLAAAVTGWVAVRAGGLVFLMLTLAIGETVHQVADTWSAVGGSNGLAGMPPISLFGGSPLVVAGFVYWWALAVAVLVFAVVALVVRSPYGRTLRGIRDNEARMRALGYRPALARYGVFCLAGAVAGVAGALWAQQARFVSPGDMGFEVAALALLSVVIGGAGSLWGPCLGAALVLLVRDNLSASIGGHGPLVLGAVFVAVVFLLPRGMAGLDGARLRTLGRARRRKENPS